MMSLMKFISTVAKRSFYVNRPLQLSLEEEHYFQLRFYSPRAISHVTIWAKIEGYDEDFKFLELEKVQPFQQLRNTDSVCDQKI